MKENSLSTVALLRGQIIASSNKTTIFGDNCFWADVRLEIITVFELPIATFTVQPNLRQVKEKLDASYLDTG